MSDSPQCCVVCRAIRESYVSRILATGHNGNTGLNFV
jgi:hypothetical protein